MMLAFGCTYIIIIYTPVVAKTNNQTILWQTCEHAIHHGKMLT